MTWDALTHWGSDTRRLRPLSGGTSNDIWLIALPDGTQAVARRGTRSPADLLWEADLLLHLGRNGLTVPAPIPTLDGRTCAEGIMVMTLATGRHPTSPADWQRVAPVLRRLHALTQGWPQRPGWQGATDLLHSDTGTRIDLTAMPPEAVIRCRAAWARLAGKATCVVHGNPNNPTNILLTDSTVTLVDWDEAHVDVPDLDLALPWNAARLPPGDLDTAVQAASAWEAAVCWDDAHARKHLAMVRPV